MTPEDWLAGIDSNQWEPGLERVRTVAATLDLLVPSARIVTVAGTNGKGSTCQYLEQICLSAGLRVGKTTSPHLRHFRERIAVDGEPVADAAIVAAFEAIEAARGKTHLTYFEYATLAALYLFRQAAVDVAILEIGLGGRLDAFNIVAPDVAVITRIALDHQQWLGNDRETIGFEKAGILRAGIPLVLTDPAPPQSILGHAATLGCDVYQMGDPLIVGSDELVFETAGQAQVVRSPELHLPAPSAVGALQAAALLQIVLAPADIEQVLAETRMPGRMQWLDDDLLVDVGHNPDAADYLARQLQAIGRPVRAINGMYADKDLAGVFARLAPWVSHWYFTDLPEARAATAAELAGQLSAVSGAPTHCYAKVSEALAAARRDRQGGELLVAFGSFPLVGAVLSVTAQPD